MLKAHLDSDDLCPYFAMQLQVYREKLCINNTNQLIQILIGFSEFAVSILFAGFGRIQLSQTQ